MVLELLRKIKHEGVDDSQYIHTLTYNDLLDKAFRDITTLEHKHLRSAERGLTRLVAKRSVPKSTMRSALTETQHAEYVTSFDHDLSHVESSNYSTGEMPAELEEINDYVKKGDKYTRIANMFRKSKKKGKDGKTAFGRYEDLATGCYEEAILLITGAADTNPLNPIPNAALSNEVMRWLDRSVSMEHGYGPDISAEGVPRIIGGKSKYCLKKTAPVVGTRLRSHWRQREALAKASLLLLYGEVEKQELTAEKTEKLREMLAKL